MSTRLYLSKDLWLDVNPIVRQIEKEDACLIFDDTVQEKASTDENEIICWHYNQGKDPSLKGINLLNVLYQSGEASIPVDFEVVYERIKFRYVLTYSLGSIFPLSVIP